MNTPDNTNNEFRRSKPRPVAQVAFAIGAMLVAGTLLAPIFSFSSLVLAVVVLGFFAVLGTLVIVNCYDREPRLKERRQPQVTQPQREGGYVPSLLELSTQATARDQAFRKLSSICEISLKSPQAGDQIATELANRYPDGLEAPIKQLAERALLTPKVLAHYEVRDRALAGRDGDRETLLGL